jgi:hypothetical protein
MAYVPGFNTDVFLSYAHGDDPIWIRAFEQALAKAVRERLGHDIRVWQDTKQLRVGHDWQNEISTAIATTAAFLVVLSPSYRTSDWCSRELTRFLGSDGSPDAVKVGDLCRLLKIVKIPWENDDHQAFLPRQQHVKFFQKTDGPEEYVEFAFSSDGFVRALQEISASIAALLRTMRRRLQKVYVASPADDVVDAWHRVRAQLNDDRYDVRPEGRLNAGYDDKVLLRDIESAVLSVHLLGPAYDAFCEHQLQLAAEAGRRRLIWFARGTNTPEQVDPRQWRLLESIREMRDVRTGVDWFPGTVQEMIVQIQSALRPKAAEASAETSPDTSVYLLHDPTTRKDAEFAEALRADLRQHEKLNVVFPPPVLSSTSDYRDRHRSQLQNCDGVLLYWNAAPDTWFDQYVPDVLYPGRKARVRAKAFLLDDPSKVGEQPVPVFHRSTDFCLTDLEPFLARLRSASVRSERRVSVLRTRERNAGTARSPLLQSVPRGRRHFRERQVVTGARRSDVGAVSRIPRRRDQPMAHGRDASWQRAARRARRRALEARGAWQRPCGAH